MTDSSARPWDRQPGETSKAFAHFRGYLRLGPDRTLVEAALRAVHSLDQYKRWSAKWRWVRRAAEYDAYQAREADLSRRVDSEEVCAKVMQDGQNIRTVVLGLLRSMIRRDPDTDALTVDAGHEARAVATLYALHLDILDRLGLLPVASGSRSRGARLHSQSAGQRDAVDERLERNIHGLPMDLAIALTPEQQAQVRRERILLRAFREGEDRILREKAQGRRPTTPVEGTEGGVAGDQPPAGGQTPGEANDGGERHVETETAGPE